MPRQGGGFLCQNHTDSGIVLTAGSFGALHPGLWFAEINDLQSQSTSSRRKPSTSGKLLRMECLLELQIPLNTLVRTVLRKMYCIFSLGGFSFALPEYQ